MDDLPEIAPFFSDSEEDDEINSDDEELDGGSDLESDNDLSENQAESEIDEDNESWNVDVIASENNTDNNYETVQINDVEIDGEYPINPETGDSFILLDDETQINPEIIEIDDIENEITSDTADVNEVEINGKYKNNAKIAVADQVEVHSESENKAESEVADNVELDGEYEINVATGDTIQDWSENMINNEEDMDIHLETGAIIRVYSDPVG